MALIVQTLNSSQGSGNYAMINDLIGQIKALLLTIPIITIISDNNPAATSQRLIKFQVGTSQHYYILWAYTTANMSWELDNIAHTSTAANGLFSQVNSNRQYPSSPLQNYNFFILHTDSVFVMWGDAYKNYIGGSSYKDLPMYTRNSDGSWFAWSSCYDFSLYTNSNDTAGGGVNMSLLTTTMSGYDTLGNYFPIQCKFVMGSQIQQYVPIALYSAYMTGLATWSVYSDGTYNWVITGQGSLFLTDKPM
jgi:hypothetical protein